MGKRILEIGCGYDSFFHDFKPGTARIIAVDSMPVFLELAKFTYQSLPGQGKVEFRHEDASRLPFGNEEFDEVIARHLYSAPSIYVKLKGASPEQWVKEDAHFSEMSEAQQHDYLREHEGKWLEELRQITKEAHRVLKPGGRLTLVHDSGRVPEDHSIKMQTRNRIRNVMEGQKGFSQTIEKLDSTNLAKIEEVLGYQFREESEMLAHLRGQRESGIKSTVDIHVFQKMMK